MKINFIDKINFSKTISQICAAGLALLGFGCSSDEPGGGGGGVCMYGTPTGHWEIRGAVTDQEGAPVTDAEIRVTNPNSNSFHNAIATTDTNSEGNYNVDDHFPHYQLKVVCVPKDPALDADSTLVDLKYIKENNIKNSWYVGHAEATVDFKLKPKQKTDEENNTGQEENEANE